MEKIVKKDFRKTREFKLPTSGLTIEMYSSVLVKDADTTSESKLSEFDKNLAIVVRAIKAWNLYESETAEKPMPITMENVQNLIPATDFHYLMEEYAKFADEQKKS